MKNDVIDELLAGGFIYPGENPTFLKDKLVPPCGAGDPNVEPASLDSFRRCFGSYTFSDYLGPLSHSTVLPHCPLYSHLVEEC